MERTIPTSSDNLNFDKVWLMFQETDKKFKDIALSFLETKDLLAQSALENERRSRETERQMKNLIKKMGETESRWGKFVESLVEGALVEMLNARNIFVNHTSMREKMLYEGQQYEFDIIAKNGKDIVIVEVKTTLDVNDVKHFIHKLKIFKQAFPEYAEKNVIGAVGYITYEGESAIFAERQGLFVIRATGESSKIINEDNFKPVHW